MTNRGGWTALDIMDLEGGGTRVSISAKTTRDWAHKPLAAWPCSTLSGKDIVVEFDDTGDMISFMASTDKGRCDNDIDAAELKAMLDDVIGTYFRPRA